jgi:predicted aldo/keto reductase-like oxidoreductase
MIYRKFGNTGIELSQLGFGLMRLPIRARFKPDKIDRVRARRMLHHAIDNGVNYLDNAFPYHRQTSEDFLGKALTRAHRKKVYLATKLPTWMVKRKSDSMRLFNEQLKRVQTDHFDMYLLHSLGEGTWKIVKKFDLLTFMDKLQKKGKIRFPGFSFHGKLSLFKKIVDAYPWVFCLIHLNYVDDHYQAGLAGLEYASKRGLAVIIMEGLRGGKLANNVPPAVLDIIAKSGRKQTPAQFAFRWLWNRSDISLVLSGMSTMEQVKENIRFASQEHRGTLTGKELELYAQVKRLYKSRIAVNCTECGYCMPCKQKVSIPFILGLYNDAHIFNAVKQSSWSYSVFVGPKHDASQCIACGECEEKCPQDIPIIKTLKKAHKELSQKK